MSSKGKLIVIDGIDGSGKGTQVQILSQRLLAEGIDFKVVDFPRYGHKSAGPVELYLNGLLGTKEEIGPKKGAVLYAVDRFCASVEIRNWLESGSVILSNRYTAANLGHQGAKIRDSYERLRFWEWNLDFEHNFLGIPRPTKNFILSVNPEIAVRLIEQKARRDYLGGKAKDIHEVDSEYLELSWLSYMELARVYPNDFEVIVCDDGKDIFSQEVVADLIWAKIQPLI